MMTKQVQDAYIVSATRLPIGKSGRGYFKNTRPDEMLVKVMQAVLGRPRGWTRPPLRTPSSAAPSPRASRA
jgi:hypothetical protein